MREFERLPLDHYKWAQLKSGFGCVFDPRPIFVTLTRRNSISKEEIETVVSALSEDICNQGELGDCEKALVPWLVVLLSKSPWSFYATSCILDILLWRTKNPSGDREIEDYCDCAIINLFHWIETIPIEDLDERSQLLFHSAKESAKGNIEVSWRLFDNAVK